MSFKKLVSLLLIGLMALFFAACSSDSNGNENGSDNKGNNDQGPDTEATAEPTEGGELNIAYSAQPPVLDPQVGNAVITAEVMGHVFESLLTTDADYNIKPMLAEDWNQSEDGLTITFKLRQGVLFHNGDEMKAEDVVASMNRWKDGPGGRGQFADAVFQEVDEYTVELILEDTLSTVLVAIAQGSSSFSAIMPKEVIESAEPNTVKEFIGTGPYEFVEWKQDQYVHLTRFDDYVGLDDPADGLYGKKEAFVDDLYFHFILDPSTRVAGIQSGQYDIAHEVPYDNVAQLESDANINNQILPGAGTLIAFLNKKEGQFFHDQKAREALATLVDYDELMIGAFSDEEFYSLNHNMMMPHQEELWYSDAGKDKYNVNDPAKAEELFAEAGYDGQTIKIMTSRDYEFMYKAAVVLEQQLESIGVSAELEVFDWATLLSNMADQSEYDYDINMVWLGYKPEPTAHHFLQKIVSGYTDSPELDALRAKFESQPTLEDAVLVYDELQEWFWDYIPALKIGDYNRIDATRSKVSNYQFSDRMILWNASISE